MDSETEIQARLQRMAEEDPHGKEAEALLRRMVAFHGPFDRILLKIIAPKDMTRKRRMNAFRTLVKRGFLEQRLTETVVARWQPYHEFFLRPEIVNLVDVDETVYRALLLYTQHNFHTGHLQLYQLIYNQAWLRLLFETIQADRRQGIKMLISMKPFNYDDRASKDTAALISERYQDTERCLYALMHLAILAERYNLKWLFYEKQILFSEPETTIGNFQNALRSILHFGRLHHDDEVFVEQTYENSTVRRAMWHAHSIRVLLRLSAVKIEQNDFRAARLHYKMAVLRSRSNPRDREPLAQARVAQALGDIEEARFIYSRLYIIGQQTEALWYWGKLEYQQGRQEEGIALCRLALHEWETTIELHTSKNKASLVKRLWQKKHDEFMAMEEAKSDRKSTP